MTLTARFTGKAIELNDGRIVPVADLHEAAIAAKAAGAIAINFPT